LGELGEFGAIGRFLDFPISTVVIYKVKDCRLKVLGNWEGLSVNLKIQNPNPIGNWTLENGLV
jgi:hypothetical protein